MIGHEVWSCNNHWDVLPPDVERRVTRSFEMHKLGERAGGNWDKIRDYLDQHENTRQALVDGALPRVEDRQTRDNKPYLWHLNRLGERGTRVILQEPHPQVAHSEAYPLAQVEARLGLNYWAGTPCYMMAMAIMEGFTHIRVLGFDQSDWEHTTQRAAFAGWCMYAMGMGIKVDGYLSWLVNFNKQRYGYDFGPEASPEAERQMWFGHPISLRYKMDSYSVRGDFNPGA
jgi:hypothetical protein